MSATKERYEREELGNAASGLSPRTLEAAARVLRVAGSDPLRGALLTRVLNALAHSTEEMGERALSEAAAAPSDYAVLLRMLEFPEVLEALLGEDPLADARLKGLEARRGLLEAEGGTFSADEVARLLGISREAVSQRRRAGRLLALSTGRRGYRYPAWQFGESKSLVNGSASGVSGAMIVSYGRRGAYEQAAMIPSRSSTSKPCSSARLRFSSRATAGGGSGSQTSCECEWARLPPATRPSLISACR